MYSPWAGRDTHAIGKARTKAGGGRVPEDPGPGSRLYKTDDAIKERREAGRRYAWSCGSAARSEAKRVRSCKVTD